MKKELGECTIDIDILMSGSFVPGKPAKFDAYHNTWIGAVEASVENFKIFKFYGHNWHEITHIFEPQEVKQRMYEYMNMLEQEREERLGAG